jgi:predicted RNase H-like HicB family nuclease
MAGFTNRMDFAVDQWLLSRLKAGEGQQPAQRKGNAEMKLKVVLESSDEGGYTVYIPSLPGCISEGETVEEALTNIREAIELYLEPMNRSM